MASGVTYQALKRLSFLPERSDEDNGSVIAGQQYDDIYFIGGAAANLTLTDCTINGLVTAPSVRVKTTSGNITLLSTDNAVIIRKSVGQATTAFLPASPADSQFVIIKDGNGDANTYNITIDGSGNTIDGGSTLVIGAPRGWNQLLWDGQEWCIIA